MARYLKNILNGSSVGSVDRSCWMIVGGWLLVLVNLSVGADSVLAPLSERFSQQQAMVEEIPNFQRHVIALFGRLGCNGRSCHGSFQGRGGFHLSMFGYDFDQDHKALLAGESRRVSLADPLASLILNKPTSDENHEGGKRFDKDGWEARMLRAWIEGGAKNDARNAGRLLEIAVEPRQIRFTRDGETVPLNVIARWDDGTQEDVTCLCRFTSKNEELASVTDQGVIASRGIGDAHIIVVYDNAVEAVSVMRPISELAVTEYPAIETPTAIDRLVVEKLRRLGIVPSPVCSDEEFLRRVCIDIAGTCPTAEEVADFIANSDPAKRRLKIDELLEHPAYGLWWSTKFCDMTGLNGPLQLGGTDFGPIVSEQWRSWMERKIRDNLPYDKLVEGMTIATSRQPGQSYADYARQMSSYTLKKAPADFTARETMPHFWFRGNLSTADDKALAFAYSFMGVRLDCAQCHKHPFDRWSQQDFKQFAAIFEGVRRGISPECKDDYDQLRADLGVPDKLPTAAIRRQSYWRWAAEGKVVPWPEVFVAKNDIDAMNGSSDRMNKATEPRVVAKLLGGSEIDLDGIDDPRRPLMIWLRQPDNPYFARAIVNRFWAHYFGRGIVDPVDDLNLANPPSNVELFDYLAQGLIEHSFDLKWLHRQIAASDTYQRSWRTNSTNATDERHFSHAIIRRLPAEVIVDAMTLATANSKQAKAFAKNLKQRRIGVQPAADLARTEFGLAVFGKPLRTINCDCEREQNPSLAQAIFVRNDQDLHAMLARSDGWIAELAERKDLDRTEVQISLIRMAYLRTLARQPHDWELARAARQINASLQTVDGFQDLMWALLNTQEFITNH